MTPHHNAQQQYLEQFQYQHSPAVAYEHQHGHQTIVTSQPQRVPSATSAHQTPATVCIRRPSSRHASFHHHHHHHHHHHASVADTDCRPTPSTRKRRGQEPVMFREVQWDDVTSADLQQQHPHRQMSAEYHHRPTYLPSMSATIDNTLISGKSKAQSGIFRRTSQTCRSKFQKAITTKTRRPSTGGHSSDAMEGIEETQQHLSVPAEHLYAGTPQFLQQYQHKTLLDRLAHPNRMLPNLKVFRYDTPQPVHGSSSASTCPFPSVAPSPFTSAQSLGSYTSTSSQQQAQFDPRGGAAARRAANIFNGSRSLFTSQQQEYSYLERKERNRRRLGSLSSAADSGADLGSNADIDMIDTIPEGGASITKLDPLSYLPTELTTLIFSYLDCESLKACQHIGPWRHLASDPLVWRGEYLRNFQKETFVNPPPIQIGGAGLGDAKVRKQDWETMHRAREQINANWAAGKGKATYMAGHTDSVYCVQFDEQKIITGSRDRTIRVWDLNTNRCVKVIGGPNVRPVPGPRVLRNVDYPAFHHAEPSVNGTPYGNDIYHVPSDFHSASILCLQYDEEILVTGSSDNDLIVWDVITFEPIKRLKQHSGGVLDVAFDANHIVSCSKDCTIVIWDRKTLQPLKTLSGHQGPVNAVQLRGNLLVSASGDGVARLWDLSKMECVREFPGKERGLAAVEFSDDAKYVLAGGNDHVTYKFEVATGQEVLQYSGHTHLVRSLFLDTQNKRVVSGSYDLDLRVYDYETGKLISVFPEWTTSWMLAAKCDYRRIVSTSQDGRILVIDFGINQDGQKVPGVELLRGCQPWAPIEVGSEYPSFAPVEAFKA